MGIVEMPVDVGTVIGWLTDVGYDTDTVSQPAIHEILLTINFADFVVDTYYLEQFFLELGIDWSTFNETEEWAAILVELDVPDLPYDVHYILSLLEYLDYDTAEVSQTLMREILEGVNWDNFVLDKTSLRKFWDDLLVDYTWFEDSFEYEEVLTELGVNTELPYDVHYVLDQLAYIGYNEIEAINQFTMLDLLEAIDYDNFVIDTAWLEDYFFAQAEIDYSSFNSKKYGHVKDELEIYDLDYDPQVWDILLGLIDLGYDYTLVTQQDLYDYLENIGFDYSGTYVWDSTALSNMFYEFGIDESEFDQDVYAGIKENIGVVDMPYDVNFIFGILEHVGYDTFLVDQQ
jgi:hypothetical protein